MLTALSLSPACAEVGIVARVKANTLDDPSDSGKLWFKLKPGESKSKSVAIYNPSNGTVVVNLMLTSAIRDESGVITRDINRPFPASEFFKFSKNDFLLRSRGTTTVEVTAINNSGIIGESFDFYLEVKARLVEDNSERESNRVGVYFPIQASYALPGFIGLGNYLSQDYSFAVTKIEGSLNSQNLKSLRLFLKNDGEVPMFFQGRVQLASKEFSELSFDPLGFNTKTVPIGQFRFVDIPLTDDVIEGNYRALVKVDNGKISQTRVFEFNLEFPSPVPIVQQVLLIIFALICAFALMLSIQYLVNPETSLISRYGNLKLIKNWVGHKRKLPEKALNSKQNIDRDAELHSIGTGRLAELLANDKGMSNGQLENQHIGRAKKVGTKRVTSPKKLKEVDKKKLTRGKINSREKKREVKGAVSRKKKSLPR
ncbi:MAG: hypothetical protein ACO4AV_13130 [bacterium]